jgi:hypothetical protein
VKILSHPYFFPGLMIIGQIGACTNCLRDGRRWEALYWVGAVILTFAAPRIGQ